MITCEIEPIPEAPAAALRKWLDMPEANTLRRVVEAMEKKAECDALAKAVLSDEYPLYKEESTAFIREAQRYKSFLEILTAVSKEQQFNSVKLS